MPTASPIIKSVKGWRREIRELEQLELYTFPRKRGGGGGGGGGGGEGGVFVLYLKTQDNLVILVIRSLFPY